jgi:hypothetical protein
VRTTKPSLWELCADSRRVVPFLFPQIVPALVDRNLVEPGREGGSLIETLDPEVGLEKNLLRHVLHILWVPEDVGDQSSATEVLVRSPNDGAKNVATIEGEPWD